MRATEAGHAWARANIKPGMTELDVYAGVAARVHAGAGHWAVVYGDFAVAPGTKRGGPPTPQCCKPGDMFILDYSVVVQGYRSDFTNTLVVGGAADGRAAAAVRPVREGDGGGREGVEGRGDVPDGLRRGARRLRRRRAWPTTSRTTPGTAWA